MSESWCPFRLIDSLTPRFVSQPPSKLFDTKQKKVVSVFVFTCILHKHFTSTSASLDLGEEGVAGSLDFFSGSSTGAEGVNSFLPLAVKPASRSINLGSAFLPSNHSSAVRAGSSLRQGGKISAWKASDYTCVEYDQYTTHYCKNDL